MKILIYAFCVATFTLFGCKRAGEGSQFSAKQERYVYKVNDKLHLAIGPIEIEESPIDKNSLRKKFKNPTLPKAGHIQHFHFFVPGETSLKDPETYKKLFVMNKRDENVVSVHIIEPWTDEMYRTSPVDSRDARIGWKNIMSSRLDSGQHPEEIQGMQCFRDLSTSKSPATGRACLAERAPGEWAIFRIIEDWKTFPNPYISTKYFTTAYGGLTVAWSAHAKHANKWREIDEKLWLLIDKWNVIEK